MRRLFGTPSEPDPADTLRPPLYGDLSLEEWRSREPLAGEPWVSFERAGELTDAGGADAAVELWGRIVDDESLESRHRLQALHARCRRPGVPNDPCRTIGRSWRSGAIAELPMGKSHDVLAAHRDGSARCLDYSGRVAIWDDRSIGDVQEAIRDWLGVAAFLAEQIGRWTEPAFPALPHGHLRIMTLTPSGPPGTSTPPPPVCSN